MHLIIAHFRGIAGELLAYVGLSKLIRNYLITSFLISEQVTAYIIIFRDSMFVIRYNWYIRLRLLVD